MKNKIETVVVFGYSDNPERYGNMAYNLLLIYNHNAIKFNPRIEDPKVLPQNFDTATLYLSEAISNKFEDVFMNLSFRRMIINPGAENPKLEKKLKEKGIEVLHACTLVMLRTDQFI